MIEYETGALSSDEWDVLARFGLKQNTQPSESYHIDSINLLDTQQCTFILETIMPKLGAPDMKVTTSLVVKRIAFLTLAPTLYAMSVYNKGLNLSISNSVFEYQLGNRLWKNGMPIKNATPTLAPKERQYWREKVLGQVFAGHLTPLVDAFYHVTGVSKRILWENVAVRVFSIYERRILLNATGAIKQRAEEDLAFLLDANTQNIFALDENPLTRFYREQALFGDPPQPVRMRRTCCFYYQATEPAEFCSNCPLLLKQKKK